MTHQPQYAEYCRLHGIHNGYYLTFPCPKEQLWDYGNEMTEPLPLFSMLSKKNASRGFMWKNIIIQPNIIMNIGYYQ